MSKCLGISEPYWTHMSENDKLNWKYFFRAIALIAGFFIAKTGNIVIDGTLAAFATAFLAVVIEPQRSYSKLSPRSRKNNVRIAIAMGSWAIAVVGIAVFAHTGITTIASFYVDVVSKDLNRSSNLLTKAILLASFVVAVPISIMRVFRQTRFEELIYGLPRDALKKLFIYERPKATSFPMFAYMELSVLLITLVYVSCVADIARVFMALV